MTQLNSSARHRAPRARAHSFLSWIPVRRGHRFAIVGAVVGALVAVSLTVMALPSQADQTTFTVTSTFVGTSTATSGTASNQNDADMNPGDGVCSAYSGGCSLKAAIQEVNALYAANSNAGPFLINFDSSIQGTNSNPTLIEYVAGNTGWMFPAKTNGLSSQDTGAVYMITAPTTVDMTGMRLGSPGLSAAIHGFHGAWFDIAGPNITIQNFWGGIYGPEASIVIAASATNATVQNGTWTPTNNYAKRFLTIQAGVSGVTARNLQLSGGYGATNSMVAMGGYFNFTKIGDGNNFSNIVLGPNIQITQASSGGTCSTTANTGGGCFNSIVGWDGSGAWDNEPYGSTSGTGTNAVAKSTSTWAFSGFTFSGNYVSGLPATGGGLCFASGDGGYYTVGPSSNFVIDNNVFDNLIGNKSAVGGCNLSPGTFGAGLIVLPRFLSGTNSISGNVFRSISGSAKTGMSDAILYFGNAKTVNNTQGSGLTIRHNYFDGWAGGSAVQLIDAGLVTVESNTFGPNNVTQSTNSGAQEEYSFGNAGTMTANYGAIGTYQTGKQTTNQGVRSWVPTGTASVLTSPPLSNSVAVTGAPKALSGMSTCPVMLTIGRSSDTLSNTQPTQGLPVEVGVYWTGAQTAEVFLGHAEITSGVSALLTVPLPVGNIALPMTGTTQIAGSADLPAPSAVSAGSATIVDPATGTLKGGFLRVQTQVAAGGSQGLSQNESSQYSRWVGITGTCTPAISLSQNSNYDGTPEDGSPAGAPAQGYTTMSRDRVFTLTSTVPLDPASVSPNSFTVSGTAPGARVTAVAPVNGSNNTQFTVVTAANDSGTIVVNVAAGAVSTSAGLSNALAAVASSTTISGTPSGVGGNTLAYVNPLSVSPTSFAIVAGDSKGQSYSISVKSGAPLPTDSLNFSVSEAAGDPYPLTIPTTSPTIAAGDSSVSVKVLAPAGTVAAGGVRDQLTQTVSSTDHNYDGLALPAVQTMVYSTDPYVTIQKEAFTGVTGGSSSNTPSNIQNTGTQIASGGSLTDGQNVWFLFHVCNVSAQSGPGWVTDLTQVQVTDNVLGSIGTIASLPAGTATAPGCQDLVYAQNPVAISANQ